MHGGIDEKKGKIPLTLEGEGKRAVNKGSMNEKESASIGEANNRGFHESCPRVIPSFRIFRLARLRLKTEISPFFFFFFKSNLLRTGTYPYEERTLFHFHRVSLSLCSSRIIVFVGTQP